MTGYKVRLKAIRDIPLMAEDGDYRVGEQRILRWREVGDNDRHQLIPEPNFSIVSGAISWWGYVGILWAKIDREPTLEELAAERTPGVWVNACGYIDMGTVIEMFDIPIGADERDWLALRVSK